MQIYLWRPGWKHADLIELGDKDPAPYDAVVAAARRGEPNQTVVGTHRGMRQPRMIDLSAQPNAGWAIKDDYQLDALGI